LDDPQSDDVGEEGVIPGGFASADRSRRPDGRPAEIRLGPEREELIDILALTATATRTVVDDIVTGLAQVRDDLFLEFETGVIGADMNAHGILLKSSQTSNVH